MSALVYKNFPGQMIKKIQLLPSISLFQSFSPFYKPRLHFVTHKKILHFTIATNIRATKIKHSDSSKLYNLCQTENNHQDLYSTTTSVYIYIKSKPAFILMNLLFQFHVSSYIILNITQLSIICLFEKWTSRYTKNLIYCNLYLQQSLSALFIDSFYSFSLPKTEKFDIYSNREKKNNRCLSSK